MHPGLGNNLIKNFHDIVLSLLKLGEDKEKYPSIALYDDGMLENSSNI